MSVSECLALRAEVHDEAARDAHGDAQNHRDVDRLLEREHRDMSCSMGEATPVFQSRGSAAAVAPAYSAPSAAKPRGMKSSSRWAAYDVSMFFVLRYANMSMMHSRP